MSNPMGTVLATLSQTTWTLGWDAVVAYDAASVNALFTQQYVANIRANQHIPPITGTITLAGGAELDVTSLTLGPPLITFSGNLTNQQANVTMSFVAGDLVAQEQSGSVKYVTGYQSLVPGDEYGLQMIVNLQDVQGAVDSHHDVVVDLKNASSFSANLLPGASTASLLGQYFQALFAKETQGTLVYPLGTVVIGTDDSLVPVMFDVCTQPVLGSSTSGAVLVLVATAYNPTGGSYPGGGYPYLIPDGYGCTVLVSSHTLFGNIFTAQYATSLTAENPTFAVAPVAGTATNPAYQLEFTGGAADAGIIQAYYDEGGGVAQQFYTGTTEGMQHAMVPLQGLTLKPANNQLTLSWSNQWGQVFTTESVVPRAGGSASSSTVNLTIEANFATTASVDATDVVKIVGSGTPTVTAPSQSWWEKLFNGTEYLAQAEQTLANAVQAPAAAIMNLALPEVGTFAVDHLLFPASNALSLTEAYVPGDLALFGQIQAPSFAVTPLTSTVASGQTVQLTTSDGSSPAWTINPQIGTISSSGLYTAPQLPTATPVVMTATSPSGAVATAVVVVVAQPVSVSEAFQLVVPNSPPVSLTATVTDGSAAATWTLSPSDGSGGSLSSAGVYTPPTTFPKELTAAVATATSGSSTASSLLVLADVVIAFELTPAFVRLGPGATQQFTALELTSGTWSVLPAGHGSVSQTGLYAAPSGGATGVAIVSVADAGNANLVGLAAVILTG